MTTKIKWRLGKLPTPDEVMLLQKQSILTKEEAREILFSLENDEDRDNKSLQDEIVFLRTLVKSLADSKTIATHIYTLPNEYKPWHIQPWYPQYTAFCAATDSSQAQAFGKSTLTCTPGTSAVGGSGYTTLFNSSTAASLSLQQGGIEPDFTAINTF